MKTFQVKVYDIDGTFLATWKDVISDVSFNNEMNSAGGQLQISLARDAGDFGEGTDVDFGHNVKVYCFDKDAPNGTIIFQGYISSYTPVYTDNTIQIIVLGYGSELGDYIIEAGDSAYVSQLLANKTYDVGNLSKAAQTYAVIQTIQLPATKNISAVDIQATTTQAGTITVNLYQYSGTPQISGSDIATGSVNVGIGTQQTYKVTFATETNLSSANTYFIAVFFSGELGLCKIHASNANPYASGTVWTETFVATYWDTAVQKAADDLYFVLYEYGGNTTAPYLSQDPTAILTDFIEDYNARGGIITIPSSPYVPKIKQEFRGSNLPGALWGNAYAQIITPGTTFDLTALQIYAGVTSGSSFITCQIYQGDPSADFVTVISGSATYSTSATLLGTVYKAITNTDLDYNTITFSTPVTLNASTQYFILFFFDQGDFGSLQFRSASTGDQYNSDIQVGQLYYANVIANNTSDGMGYSASTPAVYFKAYDVTPPPTSIIEGYIPSNSTVSYTFNVNTVLEGVNKCVELAPVNWYWYINQGTNVLEFKEKSDTPDHTFSFEKDIIDAKFEKRIEDIANVVYFTGGDTGGGVNFYKKYTIDGSIAKYGYKAIKYSDGRVTLTSTADTIANNILATKSEPELRVTLEILDNNNDMNMGYDIESISVGDVIGVRNITQQVGLSTWDIGRYDEAYWDFNIYNLSTLQMQIQKLEYKQDSVVISASTIPLDVNKRIEDINRNLEALQTANNPTTPS